MSPTLQIAEAWQDEILHRHRPPRLSGSCRHHQQRRGLPTHLREGLHGSGKRGRGQELRDGLGQRAKRSGLVFVRRRRERPSRESHTSRDMPGTQFKRKNLAWVMAWKTAWDSILILIHVKTKDLPAYSDTVYSDTPLKVTLLACPEWLVRY